MVQSVTLNGAALLVSIGKYAINFEPLAINAYVLFTLRVKTTCVFETDTITKKPGSTVPDTSTHTSVPFSVFRAASIIDCLLSVSTKLMASLVGYAYNVATIKVYGTRYNNLFRSLKRYSLRVDHCNVKTITCSHYRGNRAELNPFHLRRSAYETRNAPTLCVIPDLALCAKNAEPATDRLADVVNPYHHVCFYLLY